MLASAQLVPTEPIPSPSSDLPKARLSGNSREVDLLRGRELESGYRIVLCSAGRAESVEIRSPAGEPQVTITLGREGPVVSVSGARLELSAPESVAIRCRTIALEAHEGMRLASQGTVAIEAAEVRASTERDIHLNGAFIRLNCTPDAPLPPELPLVVPAAPPPDAVVPNPSQRGCDCCRTSSGQD